MRVDREIVRWHEGETLMFDDTYEHEVWNDTDETRVVAARPVRAAVARAGKMAGRTVSVERQAHGFRARGADNVALWAGNMRKIEDAHGLDES